MYTKESMQLPKKMKRRNMRELCTMRVDESYNYNTRLVSVRKGANTSFLQAPQLCIKILNCKTLHSKNSPRRIFVQAQLYIGKLDIDHRPVFEQRISRYFRLCAVNDCARPRFYTATLCIYRNETQCIDIYRVEFSSVKSAETAIAYKRVSEREREREREREKF